MLLSTSQIQHLQEIVTAALGSTSPHVLLAKAGIRTSLQDNLRLTEAPSKVAISIVNAIHTSSDRTEAINFLNALRECFAPKHPYILVIEEIKSQLLNGPISPPRELTSPPLKLHRIRVFILSGIALALTLFIVMVVSRKMLGQVFPPPPISTPTSMTPKTTLPTSTPISMIPNPFVGSPSITDPLTLPNLNDWSSQNGCTLTNKGYEEIFSGIGGRACPETKFIAGNFAVQFDVQFISEGQPCFENNELCLGGNFVFRRNQSGSGYVIEIQSDGTFSLLLDNQTIILDQKMPGFKQGIKQVNTIGVVAQDTHFSLYVNSIPTPLPSNLASGNTLVGGLSQGVVGFGAFCVYGPCSTTPIHVIFTHFLLWSFDNSAS